MRAAIKGAFDTMKEELDDHREAINENSNEISANYEFLVQLDNKIDKLSERIDNMQLSIDEATGKTQRKIELTRTEQRVFLFLYTLPEKISPEMITEKLGMKVEQVTEVIKNLITKGVSLIQEFHDNVAYISLERGFREKHAKENLVKLDTSVLLEELQIVKNRVTI